MVYPFCSGSFQSTPSVWRETFCAILKKYSKIISIHSLRVEGDQVILDAVIDIGISIHSLRVEGDSNPSGSGIDLPDFNPLPPCGGRLAWVAKTAKKTLFQSTPSVWRETCGFR